MSENQSVPSNIDLSIVSPYTPSEDIVKKYTSRKISGAWKLLLGTLALLAAIVVVIVLFVSVFHVIVYSIRIIIGLLIVLLLPIYGVYNLISTLANVSKKNYSFYTSEIAGKNDKGYMVKGINATGLYFLDRADANAEKTPGAPVIIAKMKDDFDLLGIE